MKRAMTEVRSLIVAGWKIPAVTLAVVVALSQVADGLAYQLAHGHGIEANPGAATFITAYGPMAMLAFKLVAAVILGVGSYALLRRGRGFQLMSLLALVGFIGCLSELRVLV